LGTIHTTIRNGIVGVLCTIDDQAIHSLLTIYLAVGKATLEE
jgi:hypothetical protein